MCLPPQYYELKKQQAAEKAKEAADKKKKVRHTHHHDGHVATCVHTTPSDVSVLAGCQPVLRPQAQWV
jgi:hypothetical protein